VAKPLYEQSLQPPIIKFLSTSPSNPCGIGELLLSGKPEQKIINFVEYYYNKRCHESINKLVPLMFTMAGIKKSNTKI